MKRAIHHLGHRKNGPFVPINCAAIPQDLLESEMFGHKKGAFTGAIKSQKGKFELANNGTLFLDEVSEISEDIQAKLLRFLQERVIEPVGGRASISIDVRIIAATNKDLVAEIEKGAFRKDLYFRLNVVSIYIPPLRERKDDIPPLIDYILQRECDKQGVKEEISIEPRAIAALQNYDWPGNVRELENVIARSIALRTGSAKNNARLRLSVIQVEDLGLPKPELDFKDHLKNMPLKDVAQQAERAHIIEILKETNWNRTKAAEILGISGRTLRYKLNDYNISRDN